jgi:hypothetical protein
MKDKGGVHSFEWGVCKCVEGLKKEDMNMLFPCFPLLKITCIITNSPALYVVSSTPKQHPY